MPWDFVLIFVVLGVVLPWRSRAHVRALLERPSLSGEERLALYATTIAAQWLAAGLVMWRSLARGLTPAELGIAWPDGARLALLTLALSAALVAHQVFSLRRLARLPPERRGFVGQLAEKILPQDVIESLAFFALAATVALCEEMVYRGFAYAALRDVADSWVLAAVGSSALFAAAHLYQGRSGLLTTFLAGLVLAGVREYTGSLGPCIVAHLAVDLAAGFYARRALGLAGRRTESVN
jgi:membrane protease YdiL (CAAX protease family)